MSLMTPPPPIEPKPDPALDRALGALRNYLTAVRETAARAQDLQDAKAALPVELVDQYTVEARRVGKLYRP